MSRRFCEKWERELRDRYLPTPCHPERSGCFANAKQPRSRRTPYPAGASVNPARDSHDALNCCEGTPCNANLTLSRRGVLRPRKHFDPRSVCCAQDDSVNSGLGDRVPHVSPLLRDVGRGHNCLWPVRQLAGIMALRLLCHSIGHNVRRLKAFPAKSAAHGCSAERAYR
jgi:hypothetical protein